MSLFVTSETPARRRVTFAPAASPLTTSRPAVSDETRERWMNQLRAMARRPLKKMPCVVVSVRGYMTDRHGLICQELGVCFPKTLMGVSYHFKTPTELRRGIEPGDGLRVTPYDPQARDYGDLQKILNRLSTRRRVYSKGVLECGFLARYDIHAYDLTQYGCPATHELDNEWVWCSMEGHETDTHCALRRATQWAHYVNKHTVNE